MKIKDFARYNEMKTFSKIKRSSRYIEKNNGKMT